MCGICLQYNKDPSPQNEEIQRGWLTVLDEVSPARHVGRIGEDIEQETICTLRQESIKAAVTIKAVITDCLHGIDRDKASSQEINDYN